MTAMQLLVLICPFAIAGVIAFVRFEIRQISATDLAERKAKLAGWAASADSGDINAQIKLAWEYARGGAIARDLRLAAEWFDRAASSGDAEARVHRARFLQLRLVPEGIRELRDLAKMGNWKAQFWLGRYYQSGAHRLSKLRAAVWFGRSSKIAGHRYGDLAKLGVLSSIATLPGKILFEARAVRLVASLLWQPDRWQNDLLDKEELLYTLNSETWPFYR
jgi:TPR repeat protein